MAENKIIVSFEGPGSWTWRLVLDGKTIAGRLGYKSEKDAHLAAIYETQKLISCATEAQLIAIKRLCEIEDGI